MLCIQTMVIFQDRLFKHEFNTNIYKCAILTLFYFHCFNTNIYKCAMLTLFYPPSRFAKGCRSRDSGAAQEDVSSHEKKVFYLFLDEGFPMDYTQIKHNGLYKEMLSWEEGD